MWIEDGKCQGVRWKCLSPTGISVYSLVTTMYTSVSNEREIRSLKMCYSMLMLTVITLIRFVLVLSFY